MNPPNAKGAKDLAALKAGWVARVARDPGKPAEALSLTGYLGDSAKEGHVRLYFDVDLSTYVDVAEDDVLHAERLPGEQSPLGEVVVWLRRAATLTHGVDAQQASGSWFEGPIVRERYAAAAAEGGLQALGGWGGPGGLPGIPNSAFACGPIQTLPPQCPIRTLPPGCIPWTLPPQCPPRTILNGCPITKPQFGCPQTLPWQGCGLATAKCPPSLLVVCATQSLACQSIACPPKSLLVACVTQISPLCPVPRTPVVPCQTVQINCGSVINCPTNTLVCPQTAANCPATLLNCPQTNFCPQSAAILCTGGGCPSAVDACPSAPGGCDTFITVINPGTTVINPGGWTGGMFG